MKKDFDLWNKEKQQLENKAPTYLFKERMSGGAALV